MTASAELKTCKFPGCARPAAEAGGPGRPPEYCDDPEHTALRSWRARHAERRPGAVVPDDLGRPVTMAAATAGKLREDLARTVEQLAGQLAGVQENLRTLGDPAAAAAQIETVTADAAQQVAEAESRAARAEAAQREAITAAETADAAAEQLDTQLQGAEADIARLDAELAAAGERTAQLEADITGRDAQLADAEQIRARLADRVAGLTADVDQLTAERDTAQARAAAAEEQARTAVAGEQRAESARELAETARRNAETETARVAAELTGLDQALAAEQRTGEARVADLHRSYTAHVEQLTAQPADAQARADTHAQRLDETSQRAARAEAQAEDARNRTEQLTTELDAARKQTSPDTATDSSKPARHPRPGS